ncbi:MAG: hypothetical protein JW850_09350, partial [Thermoflexales bacterium]|nr:hypothetical protein [Thermoflexales bacterium]
MFKLDKLQTLTGRLITEIGEILAQPLDPGAYKGVPGGADLTDIGTAWMLEKLHEVFGPSGLGWKLTYDPNDLDWFGTETKRPWAILKTAQFQYLVVDAESGEQTWVAVQCNGG